MTTINTTAAATSYCSWEVNGLDQLRTGTANDGRPLIRIGSGAQQDSALRDIRRRLPPGWTATVYVSGIDAVLTHVGNA